MENQNDIQRKLKAPFKAWLINGKNLPRIKFQPKESESKLCPDCGVKANMQHKIGCPSEFSPCRYHEFIEQCSCPIRVGEGV